MSMPSSRLEVATRPLRRARLQLVLDLRAAARGDSEPWWAFTSSTSTGGLPSASAARFSPSQCSSLSRVARRSARRRAFTKMRVRAVRQHQLEQPRVHGRPDASAARARPPRARTPARRRCVPSSAMSSTGMTTSISSGLRTPASTIGDRARPAVPPAPLGAAEEAGDLLQRALRGRQADALWRPRRRPSAPSARAARG